MIFENKILAAIVVLLFIVHAKVSNGSNAEPQTKCAEAVVSQEK